MKITKLLISIIGIFFLCSCAEYSVKTNSNKKDKKYFSSSGFALIYNDDLYNKKIINKKLPAESEKVIHSILKRNTTIKLINPANSKSIESKVYKKAVYPKIFNVVISKEIASFLELDENNPYLEIIEVKNNKKFVAKKSNTFDEEKNVAEKAPVDEVEINDLSENKKNNKEKKIKKNNFLIIINDFYYADSANNLKKDLIKKTNFKNISVKKINSTKYRLYAGPFKNFKALKTTYISLNNLGFNNLNIYNE